MTRSLIGSISVIKRNKKRCSVTVVVAVLLVLVNITLLSSYPTFYIDSEGVIRSDTILESEASRTLNSTLLPCPIYPTTLKGVAFVVVTRKEDVNLAGRGDVQQGGWWSPSTCRARQKLAIIIPYRNRLAHLRLLLHNLHPFLHRQQRHYRIFVIEQAYDETFNKGRIMNIAVKEVLRLDDWDCVVFHDVDLIPQNDMNLYECTDQPRHLSPGIDEMRYTLMYWDLVGGVLAMTPRQLSRVNGFSNLYWGWGAEDDDMYRSIELLHQWERWPVDGLNSISSLNYTIVERTDNTLFTNITVNIGRQLASRGEENASSISKLYRFVKVKLNKN